MKHEEKRADASTKGSGADKEKNVSGSADKKTTPGAGNKSNTDASHSHGAGSQGGPTRRDSGSDKDSGSKR